MSKILDILGGGLIGKIGDIWDDNHLSKQEKMDATFDLLKTELQAKTSIIMAELAQGDNYTKRARPTIVYFGLVVIGLNHVILPWAAYFAAMFCTAEGCGAMPNIELPEEFWWTWGGICGTWVIGRSAEKRGVKNKLIDSIVG